MKEKEAKKTEKQAVTPEGVTKVSLDKSSDSGSETQSSSDDDEVQKDSESEWRPKRAPKGQVTSKRDDTPSSGSPTV